MISQLGSASRQCRAAARAAAFLAVGILWFSAAVAQTQLVDCSGRASGGGAYQVYLDEMAYMKAFLKEDPVLEQFVRRLTYKLSSNAHAVIIQEAPVTLSFALCEERTPSSESQFNEGTLDSLDDDYVILELWGQLDAKREDGAVRERTARVGYVLVPVLVDEHEKRKEAGFQFVEYPKQPAPDGELVDLLKQSVELEAFVAAGIGLNLLRNEEYADALGYLCRSVVLLEQQDVGIPETARASLVEVLKDKAVEAVTAAGAGPAGQDWLTELVDTDQPCPEGGD